MKEITMYLKSGVGFQFYASKFQVNLTPEGRLQSIDIMPSSQSKENLLFIDTSDISAITGRILDDEEI